MSGFTAQNYFGSVRFDDPEIPGSEVLYRHCRTPVQIVPVRVGAVTVGEKISDQAFKGRSSDAGVSIEIDSLLAKANKSWSDRYGLMPNTKAMISVTAADARVSSKGVAWTPKPKQPDLEGFARAENEFHGEIILPITPSQARQLFSQAKILRSDVGGA